MADPQTSLPSSEVAEVAAAPRTSFLPRAEDGDYAEAGDDGVVTIRRKDGAPVMHMPRETYDALAAPPVEPAMPVYYPHGGRLLLLHWATDDIGAYIVLARTERSIVAVAKHVFHRYAQYVKIKGYLEIEVVDLPPRLRAIAAEHRRRMSVSTFHQEIVGRMRDVIKAGKALPPPFAPCPKYEATGDDEVGDVLREMHYECRNCFETISLVGMTPDELYARHHDAWLAAHPDHPENHPRKDRSRSPSRAEPAKDDEPLWYARAEFGHHSKGIVLSELDGPEPDEGTECPYEYDCLSDRAMFFFRRLRELDPSPLQAMIDKAKTEADAADAQYREARDAEHNRKNREGVESTIAFFSRAEANRSP